MLHLRFLMSHYSVLKESSFCCPTCLLFYIMIVLSIALHWINHSRFIHWMKYVLCSTTQNFLYGGRWLLDSVNLITFHGFCKLFRQSFVIRYTNLCHMDLFFWLYFSLLCVSLHYPFRVSTWSEHLLPVISCSLCLGLMKKVYLFMKVDTISVSSVKLGD